MSVQKLRKETIGFTQVANAVVEQITDPAALGLYVYLMSKPDDWHIRPIQIQNHFGIGRDKYNSMMRILRDLGVSQLEYERDENGHIIGSFYVLNSHLPEVGLTDSRINRQSDKPTIGKSGYLQTNILQQTNKPNKQAVKAQKRLPPLDWRPSTATEEWFATLNPPFTVNSMIEEFIDGCHAKGHKYLDFDAAFRNWTKGRIKREATNGQRNHRPRSGAESFAATIGLGNGFDGETGGYVREPLDGTVLKRQDEPVDSGGVDQCSLLPFARGH